MAELERKYIIPLRKEWLKVPIYKRAKKAVTATKEFLQKHMKTEDVRLGKYLNQEIWARGMRRPPHKIEVLAKKVEEKDQKYVLAELLNAPKEEAKKPETKKKGKITDRIKDALVAPEDKEREDEMKKETEEKRELLEKQTETRSEMAHPQAVKEKAKTDQRKEIYGLTGKTKQHAEKTGKY